MLKKITTVSHFRQLFFEEFGIKKIGSNISFVLT